MKKRLAILLSACMLLTSVSLPVEAAEPIMEGGESYHGYVEVPGEAPESIYEGLSIVQVGENIPASYDARDYGHVTSVKNQNPFGTCWSFSTMAALESSLLSQGIYTDVDLSEYHLVSYSFNGVPDPLGGTSKDSITYAYDMATALQAGGNVTVAYHALANWVGAVDEQAAAYPTGSDAIEELPLSVESAYLNDIVHLQQAYVLNKSDTAAIKQAIMDYGAVTGSFYYSSGYLNGDAYYINTRTDSNHGVTIVGWDDNYSKTNFGTQPSANGAWLVKNSWDTWFGDEGYCWLSYEDTSLQSTICVLIGEKADNYDNNYQLDGTYLNSTYTFEQAVAANVFQVQDGDYAESLDAVAFEIGSPNVNYSIQIYTDLSKESDPTSGTARLAQPVTGTATFQGYHTIKLPQSVLLEPNQTFSVVISFDKGGESFGVPVEGSMTWNSITFTSSSEENQSFLQYDGNSFWWDVGSAGNANLRIKAFTTNTNTETSVAVSGVNVTPETAILYMGDTTQLSAAVLPEAATNKNVTWESSDTTVASVDANGLVTAMKQGEAIITCTTVDGSYTDTVTITILPISLVAESQKLLVGENIQLLLNINGLDQPVSVNTEYNWSVEPEGVVEVSADGVITGQGVGKATITCTHKENAARTAAIDVEIEIPFTDIRMTDWQYPYVVYAYQNNLMSGKAADCFDMNGKLTRAEFVTVLYSYSGKPEVTYVQEFSDVASSAWYALAVTWAKQNNVTAGYADGRFGVSDNITREQLVVMLYGYAKNAGLVDGEIQTDLSTYSDVDKVSSWAREAFAWAVQNNIVSGKVNTEDNTPILDPQGNATRGECATIMRGFIESMK